MITAIKEHNSFNFQNLLAYIEIIQKFEKTKR